MPYKKQSVQGFQTEFKLFLLQRLELKNRQKSLPGLKALSNETRAKEATCLLRVLAHNDSNIEGPGMKKPFIRSLGILSVTLALLGVTALVLNRNTLLRKFSESVINFCGKSAFHNSVRVGKAFLKPGPAVRLEHLQGQLRFQEAPLDLTLHSLEITPHLWPRQEPGACILRFENLRPRTASGEGFYGTFTVPYDGTWCYFLNGEIQGLDLADLTWISPETLKGASGRISGSFKMNTEPGGTTHVELDIAIPKPGGRIQSRFLDLLLPYVPQLGKRDNVRRLVAQNETVPYEDAKARILSVSPETIKVVLHISFPDYNLNLNLSVDIRLEEKNSLRGLTRALGLIRSGAS